MQAFAALLLMLAAPLAMGYTAEELVAKNLDAKGGLEALHAIHSLRLTGKLIVSGGTLQLHYVTLVALPHSLRAEAELQGLTQVQAFDGEQAWQINPFQGRKDPEKLSADDAKGMSEDAADMLGPLVDYRQKGYELRYLGTEDVDGTAAHKLRLTRPNGDILYVYLDPDYFLEIRTLSHRIEHGVPSETVTDYGDYEKVNGVYLALEQESGPKGSNDKQTVQVEKAEVNVPVDAAAFRFPAPTSAAAHGGSGGR